MKKQARVVIGLVAVILLLSYAQFKSVDKGLRVVTESVPCTSSGCFEAISHFEYLYDGATKISRVESASVSPSGRYAAYSNDTRVMLYKRGSGNSKDVTHGRNGLPNAFEWNEAHSKVTIDFCQDNPNPVKCPPLIIQLDSQP